MTLRVPCPAKINTFLSVGPRDERGYHSIRTTFQAIGLFDELTIRTTTGGSSIESDWRDMPEENTVSKALRLAAELIPLPNLEIRITKRIPAQAGLGGGSSDAAGLLRAIRILAPRAADDAFLRDVALAVGSDVPFFLVGGRAHGEGYGERLTPLPDLPTRHLVVAKPDAGCSTREAYARLDECEFPWLEFPDVETFHNDFERVAPCASLDLSERLRANGASAAMLCGSGSAVFGVFASEEEANAAAKAVLREGAVWSQACKTIQRSECLVVERID